MAEMAQYRDRAKVTHYLPDDVRVAECMECGAACASGVRELPRIAWSLSDLAGYIPCDKVRGHRRPICEKCSRRMARKGAKR